MQLPPTLKRQRIETCSSGVAVVLAVSVTGGLFPPNSFGHRPSTHLQPCYGIKLIKYLQEEEW